MLSLLPLVFEARCCNAVIYTTALQNIPRGRSGPGER
jgi:hypothetical protein